MFRDSRGGRSLSPEEQRAILDRDVDFSRTLRETERDHRNIFVRSIVYTEMLRTEHAELGFVRVFSEYSYLFDLNPELRLYAATWRVANLITRCFLNRPIDFGVVRDYIDWVKANARGTPLDQRRLRFWLAMAALFESSCYESSLLDFQKFLRESVTPQRDEQHYVKLLATLCVRELGQYDRFKVYRLSFKLANRAARKVRFRIRNLSNLLGLELYWHDSGSFDTAKEIESLSCCDSAKKFFTKRARVYAEACKDAGRAIPFF